MAKTIFDLDCGQEEPVVLEMFSDGSWLFHGYDEEAELAAQELGFAPSICYAISREFELYSPTKIMTDFAGAGSQLMVKIALAAGADVHAPNQYGDTDTALQEASGGGHVEIVKILLEHGADVHAADQKGPGAPLRRAARVDHVEVVELLLEAGADPAANYSLALAEAVENGCADSVELLLDAGADAYALGGRILSQLERHKELELNFPISTPHKGTFTAIDELLDEWFEEQEES
jgi:ankyrin repeat protein